MPMMLMVSMGVVVFVSMLHFMNNDFPFLENFSHRTVHDIDEFFFLHFLYRGENF
jgi:hypothetical protein